ncbi:MAG: TraR/DksA family transcriptional regulator [Pseudomonadales bacterium]|nr:TraR/DksA family transcriptional regulator [Pseudomonadales bacterium]
MDFDKIKAELLERKAELESRLERTHKHIYQKEEPVSANFSEQVKQTENDAIVKALEADGIEEIAQVTSALNRIEEGNYELCVACGAKISEERLEAIPYTDRCIDCAE